MPLSWSSLGWGEPLSSTKTSGPRRTSATATAAVTRCPSRSQFPLLRPYLSEFGSRISSASTRGYLITWLLSHRTLKSRRRQLLPPPSSPLLCRPLLCRPLLCRPLPSCPFLFSLPPPSQLLCCPPPSSPLQFNLPMFKQLRRHPMEYSLVSEISLRKILTGGWLPSGFG